MKLLMKPLIGRPYRTSSLVDYKWVPRGVKGISDREGSRYRLHIIFPLGGPQKKGFSDTYDVPGSVFDTLIVFIGIIIERLTDFLMREY